MGQQRTVQRRTKRVSVLLQACHACWTAEDGIVYLVN